jgi:hypothetical protein
LTDDDDLETKDPLIRSAASLFKLAALAGFVTTAFGFPAVMYRLQSVHVPLAFLSNADALTAGLIPAAFLSSVYLSLLALLKIIQADTPDQTVSLAIKVTGVVLGMFAFVIPMIFLWIIVMLFIGAQTPLLHLFHLSFLAHRHEIPQADLTAAFGRMPIWPAGILFLMIIVNYLVNRYGLRIRWPESIKQWFSPDRMAEHFSVCALLAVIVGLTVMTVTAVALGVVTAVAIREFQMDAWSTVTCLLTSLTLGVIAFCTVLVLGPGSPEGLRNLKPASFALYLVIVTWYSVRFYPDIPQWLGGGRPVAAVLWMKAEEAPAVLTQDKNDWSAAEDGHGLVRVEASMLYATAEAVVILGKQEHPVGIVISRHSITALEGG